MTAAPFPSARPPRRRLLCAAEAARDVARRVHGLAGMIVAPGDVHPLTAFTALLCIRSRRPSGALNMPMTATSTRYVAHGRAADRWPHRAQDVLGSAMRCPSFAIWVVRERAPAVLLPSRSSSMSVYTLG